MRIPTKPIAGASRLDGLVATVRCEAEGAEGDPFDDAMVAGVAGLAEAMKPQADALAGIEVGQRRTARRAVR